MLLGLADDSKQYLLSTLHFVGFLHTGIAWSTLCPCLLCVHAPLCYMKASARNELHETSSKYVVQVQEDMEALRALEVPLVLGSQSRTAATPRVLSITRLVELWMTGLGCRK